MIYKHYAKDDVGIVYVYATPPNDSSSDEEVYFDMACTKGMFRW